MSFLSCAYPNNERSREIRIISLEQVIGNHLKLPSNFRSVLSDAAEKAPEIFNFSATKKFYVIGPNSVDITCTLAGKSRFFLIQAIKSPRKKFSFLILGNMVWGIEVASGFRLKKSVEKHGKEKTSKYILKVISSILEAPESLNWQHIDVFYR